MIRGAFLSEEFQRQYREEYGWTDEAFAINDEMAERKQGVMLLVFFRSVLILQP
ncbi:MAG: hypothetical protein GX331_08040 [Firmicutes bacterium]|nr:hypothetical protein [Bacillota bacterium]